MRTKLDRSEVTKEVLMENFDYDWDTGDLIWKETPRRKKRAGTVAGTITANGYKQVRFAGRDYLAHHLVFILHHGHPPKKDIDHKNHIRHDNRIRNLRDVSRSFNIRNSKMNSNNTSGMKGVTRIKSFNKWMAYIVLHGKFRNLGYYKDFDDAVCARLAAEQYEDWPNCASTSPAYVYVRELQQNG